MSGQYRTVAASGKATTTAELWREILDLESALLRAWQSPEPQDRELVADLMLALHHKYASTAAAKNRDSARCAPSANARLGNVHMILADGP